MYHVVGKDMCVGCNGVGRPGYWNFADHEFWEVNS